MSAEEIESYKFQLEQVELALQSDPENEELKKLQHDLQELISMFEAVAEPTSPKKKDAYHQQPPPSTPAAPAASTASTTTTALKAHEFSVDQEVMARWSGDGEFYKATITAIGGADQVFSVKFKGYSEAEVVKAEDIKPLQTKKRTGVFENVGEPKKKRKDTATSSTSSAGGGAVAPTGKKKKAAEFENKKNAWLNFATGGSKKKKATPVINKKSIFKTPDNPEGKVGVVGSGKGMTSYQQRAGCVNRATPTILPYTFAPGPKAGYYLVKMTGEIRFVAQRREEEQLLPEQEVEFGPDGFQKVSQPTLSALNVDMESAPQPATRRTTATRKNWKTTAVIANLYNHGRAINVDW
ncbi:hypothetical protein MBANPS3_007777 [Mucor bainieri]